MCESTTTTTTTTHRQNPLLAAARESGHIPPSFSNKAINAVPSPVWPRSQLRHTTRCLVPIGHDLSYSIPAVSFPLATISATPYQLSRPHRPRAQLRHTSCLVPIAATSSALPYQLSRPHCGHELSFTIPAVSSPLATSSATPYLPLAVPVPLRSQLKHLYTVSPIHKMCSRPSARLNTCSNANTPPPAPGPIYRVRMRQLRQRPKEKEG